MTEPANCPSCGQRTSCAKTPPDPLVDWGGPDTYHVKCSPWSGCGVTGPRCTSTEEAIIAHNKLAHLVSLGSRAAALLLEASA